MQIPKDNLLILADLLSMGYGVEAMVATFIQQKKAEQKI
jgi:hypothetical protein